LELTEHQQGVYDAVKEWFRGSKRQELTFGGYAGTGKTVTASVIASGDDFGYVHTVAPTGKAVRVLRSKGIHDAETIHSFVYRFVGKDANGQPIFDTKETEEPDLLVADESSMVPMPVYQDLLATGLRILWIGDHGQLEPVGEDAGLMKDPEIRLEEILRQAKESPILAFAHECRQGIPPRDRIDVPGLKVDRISDYLYDTERLLSFGQILVAFNRTRTSLNNRIREHLGFKAKVEVGDKLIIRRNNRRRRIFNGMIVVVEKIHELSGKEATVDLRDDDDRLLEEVKLDLRQLGNNQLVDPFPGVGLADYGYAITVHKSQGSQWDRVLVVEEFCPKWSMPRWRYTAQTRAAKELVYLTNEVKR